MKMPPNESTPAELREKAAKARKLADDIAPPYGSSIAKAKRAQADVWDAEADAIEARSALKGRIRLSKRQREILVLMYRQPDSWPLFVDWSHVSAWARRKSSQGLRDQALRRTLGSLERKGLVATDTRCSRPFCAFLTNEGDAIAQATLLRSPA
jgi:hypothetical protein